MTYLLDTNVVSESMKARPEPRVTVWFLEHRAADVYLSVLTLGELVRGARKHPDEGRRHVLETWIRNDLARQFRGRILPFDTEAAVITPTPDIFNMILFAAPMIMLFFVGIGASYLFVLYREGRGVPWRRIIIITALILVVIVLVAIYYLQSRLGYQFVPDFPWFIKP